MSRLLNYYVSHFTRIHDMIMLLPSDRLVQASWSVVRSFVTLPTTSASSSLTIAVVGDLGQTHDSAVRLAWQPRPAPTV